MLQWWRDRVSTRRIGREIYDSIVAQARSEAFYRDLGVPDTMEGRFELIVLHMSLVLERLQRDGNTGRLLARAVIEAFVTDMDDTLREIGIGDLGVPRRVKRAAAAIYERGRIYADARRDPGATEALARALAEHVYGSAGADASGPLRLAAYVHRSADGLAQQPSNGVLEGRISFPDATAARYGMDT